MNSYKLIIQYDGSLFSGWQIQSQGERTVQEELLNAAKKISKSEDVRLLGSGRTDTGVHALGQVAKLDWPLNLAAERVIKAFNAILPKDIRVRAVERVLGDFHPIQNAKIKEYHYYFAQKDNIPPFANNYVAPVIQDFDLDDLNQIAQRYVGVHDFINLHTVGSEVKSTTREIYSCEVCKLNFAESGAWSFPVYVFKIRGAGFLKQMVRMMVGAMLDVARGHRSIEIFEDALAGKSGHKLFPVAPSQGLYLIKVEYSGS